MESPTSSREMGLKSILSIVRDLADGLSPLVHTNGDILINLVVSLDPRRPQRVVKIYGGEWQRIPARGAWRYYVRHL